MQIDRVRRAAQRLAIFAAPFVALLACGDAEEGGAGSSESAMADTALPARLVYAVQVGSYADSARAGALRDSLGRAGWSAYARRADARGQMVWRVLVAPAAPKRAADLVAFALKSRGRDAVVVTDSAVPSDPEVVDVVRVNERTQGMSVQPRWALSPDRRSIVVVDDPVSVEAESVPDGVFFASEEPLRQVQLDSVWDVAPSPDWKRAVFGLAHVMRGGEQDTLATAQWEELAGVARMPLRDVREGAFPVSGMATMVGFAQPGIVELESGERRVFPVAAGWRVGWSNDGSRMAAGRAPATVQDDAPATLWVALDPRDGTPKGELPADAQLAPIAWTESPALDVSITLDTGKVALAVEGGGVESRGGWIRVRGRIIGPGIALATTRGGRYIVAAAPNPAAREGQARDLLVVYVLGAPRD